MFLVPSILNALLSDESHSVGVTGKCVIVCNSVHVTNGKSSRPVSRAIAPDFEGLKACIEVTDD